MIRVGIGQDSHRFMEEEGKPCVVGGLVFSDAPGLDADSDGDVVLHAICNAISSVGGVPILGGVAIEMCKAGERNSRAYLEKAIETLGEMRVVHVALTIEGKRPKFQIRSEEMRENVATLIGLDISQVGITFTSGDGLTDFGKGFGLQCFCIVTVEEG
jgi:2-C-methyl-D-erythritol 2,4-cyclodiphosphate synthase